MKDIQQYGLPKGGNWELLPWIANPRPPFKIWATSERIEPFFTIEHYPKTLAVILRTDIGFKKDVFKKAGLSGSSRDWERLTKAYIREQEYEDNFFWVDLMEFDTDEDIFCVFSEYIDDLQKLAIMLRKACEDETYMLNLLTNSSRGEKIQLTAELISQGFSLQAVIIDDLGNYIDVKKVCYKKYVEEYYGGWIDSIQIKMNTDAFNDMIKEKCFQKLLLNNVPVGFLSYNELDDKIEGISIQMIEVSQRKGVGSFYLKYITSLSKKVNKPILLKVFKSNPAQNLYKRFGFKKYSETETHYLMRYNPIENQ